MIVRDEEKFLEQCLNSAKEFVDEIIIVDTGSTDRTISIAEKFTNGIHQFEWCDDFSKARNESLKYAAKDWILVLDADETIESRDFLKIKQAINSEAKAFRLNVVNLTRSGNKIFRLVRLFRNREGFQFRNKIHELIDESIIEKGHNIKELDAAIIHYGIIKSDEEKLKKKAESYISLILKQLEEDPDSPRFNHQAGNAYLQLGDLDSALTYFQKTASINPKYKLIYSDIGQIYFKKGMLKEAIAYYTKSAELNPDNPSPFNNLAVLYGLAGEMDKARQTITELMQRFPENKAVKENYRRIMNS
jgi:glycosyltransferase involved in cell wall biosynthesis